MHAVAKNFITLFSSSILLALPFFFFQNHKYPIMNSCLAFLKPFLRTRDQHYSSLQVFCTKLFEYMKYCEKWFSVLFKSQCLSWYFLKIIYKKSFLIVAINNIFLATICCFFNLRLSMSICLNMFEYLQIVVSQLMRGLKIIVSFINPLRLRGLRLDLVVLRKQSIELINGLQQENLHWSESREVGRGERQALLIFAFVFQA